MQSAVGVPAPKKILIVDDDPIVVQQLMRVLEKLGGYQTSIAMDGMEALEQARQSPPDLMILDLMLPLLSGEVVCKEIKRDEKTKGVPIIILSGKSREADKIICKVIGADYYMTKPFDIPELLKTAKEVFLKAKDGLGLE